MSDEVLITLITAFFGTVGSITGAIATLKGNKNAKELINPIKKQLEDLQEDHSKRTIQINGMQGQLEEMSQNTKSLEIKVNNQEQAIKDNEMNRLQTTIMNFAQDLRNGHSKTLNSFHYICHAYDRYKALGGNSFVDAEMDFIKEEMDNKEQELKKAGIKDDKTN